MKTTAIGIDLGGTRIKAVAMDADGQVLKQSYTPTNDSGDDAVWKAAVKQAVEELAAEFNWDNYRVGLSAPGLPEKSNRFVRCMPGRLQGLEQFRWSEFLGQPAWILNDAVAALVAEARFGSARPYRHAVLLTLGTGVGGAILIDGKPYQGAFQKAGHIGHMVIDADGTPDVTGMPGSLEDAIGNVTIARRSDGRFNDTHALLNAYRNGDPFANEIWLQSVRKLALGIASIINILSPECIVLGGGIAEAGDDLFVPLSQFLDRYEWKTETEATQVLRAEYGDLCGAAGAAWFALQQE